MWTTLAAWLLTFGIVVTGGGWDTPTYVHDEQPAAPYQGVVGLTCHWFSDHADHPLAEYCMATSQHITVFAPLVQEPSKAIHVAYHERLHVLYPEMTEQQAWTWTCNRYWIQRWCGAGAYRGGT